jgi:tetratricopeptide (TPR) repeat protein
MRNEENQWPSKRARIRATSVAIRSLLILVCYGCANPHVAPAPAEFFLDDHFSAPSGRISVEDVFALSDAMKRYLDGEIASQVRASGRQRALIDALYSKSGLRLEYDSALTRNASQAFDARSGNCLSLVIMTAAFAKALGLEVFYQTVAIDEIWSRRGGVYFLNGHVNLTLGQKFDPGRQLLTIDFLPANDLRGLRTSALSEETVVAMYMNNRAAESLASGRLDDAYWWARAAIGESPAFMAAYNTLGVVYLRHGDLIKAEQVFTRVLDREPQNTRALANLAAVLNRQERLAELAIVNHKLAQLEGHAPFHFFDLGMAAMEAGEYRVARDYFTREAERSPDYHEVHFWLGIAELKLGDLTEARKHLEIALANSTSPSERGLYAAKLRRIAAESNRQ